MNIIAKNTNESQEVMKNKEGPTEGIQQMEIEGMHEDKDTTDTEGMQEGMQKGKLFMEGLSEGRNTMNMERLSEGAIIVTIEGICEGTMALRITSPILPLIQKKRATMKPLKLMGAINTIYHSKVTTT
jgi:hypothetical protein